MNSNGIIRNTSNSLLANHFITAGGEGFSHVINSNDFLLPAFGTCHFIAESQFFILMRFNKNYRNHGRIYDTLIFLNYSDFWFHIPIFNRHLKTLSQIPLR